MAVYLPLLMREKKAHTICFTPTDTTKIDEWNICPSFFGLVNTYVLLKEAASHLHYAEIWQENPKRRNVLFMANGLVS